MSDKLAKLQKLIEIANEGLNKEEFLSAFQTMLDVIKKTEASLNVMVDSKINRLADLESRCQQAIRDIERIGQSTVSSLKKQVEEQVGETFTANKVNKRLVDKIAEVDERISEIQSWIEPDPALIAMEAAEIMMETMKKDEKEPEELTIDSIKGLREILNELRTLLVHSKTTFVGGGGGSGNGGRICKSYDLSPRLDGSTRVFSLPAMWRIISIHLSSVPNILRDTIDYTYDAGTNTLTFTSEVGLPALSAGQTCLIVFAE